MSMATVTDKYNLFIIVYYFSILRSGQNVASEESRFMNIKCSDSFSPSHNGHISSFACVYLILPHIYSS